MAHVHESPWVMLVPLLVLAAGAVVTGFAFKPYFIGEAQETFWNGAVFNLPAKQMMEALHHAPSWVPTLAKITAGSGILLAFALYMGAPHMPARLADAFPAVHRFLLNKWYFDELYDALFVRPFRAMARVLWKTGDVRLIDGMPNGAAALAVRTANGASRLQTGRVASYAFTMIIGLVIFVSLFAMGLGR